MSDAFQEPQPLPQDNLEDHTVQTPAPAAEGAQADGGTATGKRDGATPSSTGMENSSVDVKLEETTGVLFLGILTLILLFAYMRAQGKIRELTEALAEAS